MASKLPPDVLTKKCQTCDFGGTARPEGGGCIIDCVVGEKWRPISMTPVDPSTSVEAPDCAMKQKAGKLRYDLVPPQPLEALAKVYTMGAQKYAPRNWEKGVPWMDCYAAIMRHLQDWRNGKDVNEETLPDGTVFQGPSLAHVAWWCFALLEYASTHPELDDRPKPPVKKAGVE